MNSCLPGTSGAPQQSYDQSSGSVSFIQPSFLSSLSSTDNSSSSCPPLISSSSFPNDSASSRTQVSSIIPDPTTATAERITCSPSGAAGAERTAEGTAVDTINDSSIHTSGTSPERDRNAIAFASETMTCKSTDTPADTSVYVNATAAVDQKDLRAECEAPCSVPLILNLPDFSPAAQPDFTWGCLSGEDFCHSIHCAYAETVHWKRNIFLVPSGKIGKQFVRELTTLFRAFAPASAMESIALESIMVASTLLLQKPHFTSKCSDHITALERRLKAWKEGDIDGLLREGRAIQSRLVFQRYKSDHASWTARNFAKLVFEGKIHSALRFLSENQGNGILDLNQPSTDGTQRTVGDVLREKHPPAREAAPEALITTTDEPPLTHPVVFDGLTGSSIRSAALRTKGSAGPSHVDAAGWRRLCTSFHRESADLCSAIAAFARRICTEFVDPKSLEAFLSCRLIPLDKSPGVRPIGVSEVLRRIVGKAVMEILRTDLLTGAGPCQLSGGHEAGAEAAVHVIRSTFEDAETDAVLFVDAANAFNNLNRRVALLNIRYICPNMSIILINCYRSNTHLFVGGAVLFSCEGTTQGDPLAMAMFALATRPLINAIMTNNTIQAWFADDAAAGGKLRAIRLWWDALIKIGPKFGYYPNAAKTYLLVKEGKHQEATEIFGDTQVQITMEGRKYLGGALGTKAYTAKYSSETVDDWVREVQRLAKFATTQPHAAYAALTHGLISRWTYSLRVNQTLSEEVLQPLEKAISQSLIPALTGQPAPNNQTRQLLALPCRLGGMGIVDATKLPAIQQPTSQALCRPLVDLIKAQEGDTIKASLEQQALKRQFHQHRRKQLETEALAVMSSLPHSIKKSALVAQEKGVSSWLSALPIQRFGFALHKGAFRDAIALRYGWPLHLVPETCACGQPFSTDHALICKCGGFVVHRHDELRDLTASLLRDVCRNVSTEPVLQPLTGEQLERSANTNDQARLDIRATGFWGEPHQDAFFDIRVFYPLASSYRSTSIAANYRQQEARKRREYGQRVRDVEHGCFTPLVFTTGGGMAREATVFFKRLASMLSEKKQESYAQTMGWLRCCISFLLLRASITCIRGTRKGKINFDKDSILEATASVCLPQ